MFCFLASFSSKKKGWGEGREGGGRGKEKRKEGRNKERSKEKKDGKRHLGMKRTFFKYKRGESDHIRSPSIPPNLLPACLPLSPQRSQMILSCHQSLLHPSLEYCCLLHPGRIVILFQDSPGPEPCVSKTYFLTASSRLKLICQKTIPFLFWGWYRKRK